MEIKKEEMDKRRIIILICALILTLAVTVSIFFIGKGNTKDISIELYYRPLGMSSDGRLLILDKKENKELNNIIARLELTETKSEMTKVLYEIKYNNEKYLIGTDNIISKGGRTYSVTRGLDELNEFIQGEVKEEEIVELYIYEDFDKYTKVELTEEDKKIIRDSWSKQEVIETIDLALLVKYAIVVDDITILTDSKHFYATFNGEYVILDLSIGAILDKYSTGTEKVYVIDEDVEYYDSRFTRRGVYIDFLNQPNSPIFYNIASGMKNTGGYSISIEGVDIDNNNNVVVHIKETSPRPTDMVTQAITYPTCRIVFYKEPKTIKFLTEDNEELSILNIKE